MLKRFKAFFGPIPLTAITPELVSEYVAERIARDGIKPITANRDLQLLKSMFEEVLFSEPLRGVEPPNAA